MTRDMQHVTCDMWHMVGGEHSLILPSSYGFENNSVLKIGRKMMIQSLNQLINSEGDFRTALATPGLLASVIASRMHIKLFYV